MPGKFFDRLRKYYVEVAHGLRGEAGAASIFPNSTDVGMSRERVYAEFLRRHAPSKCNVFFGGFLFGNDGSESRQLDVIITTDTAPKFDLHNPNGQGKAFSPVEGTLAVASIKSTLDKYQLEESLAGIADIPPTTPLKGRALPNILIQDYDDWPYKILYASDSISFDTLIGHLHSFYSANPNIPSSRRPNIIHASGKYIIVRAVQGMIEVDSQTKKVDIPNLGAFYVYIKDPDLQGMLCVLHHLQTRAMASTYILYDYRDVINKVLEIPTS